MSRKNPSIHISPPPDVDRIQIENPSEIPALIPRCIDISFKKYDVSCNQCGKKSDCDLLFYFKCSICQSQSCVIVIDK